MANTENERIAPLMPSPLATTISIERKPLPNGSAGPSPTESGEDASRRFGILSNGSHTSTRKGKGATETIPTPNGPVKEPSYRLPSPRAITPPSPSQVPGDVSPSKGRAAETGFSTPPGRRSVQFARSPLANEFSSGEDETPRSDSKDAAAWDWRASTLLNKLRSYTNTSTTPTHRRRHSDHSIQPAQSPSSESEGNQLSDQPYEDETEDADSEGSDEDREPGAQPRQRRRMRTNAADTAPTTPRSGRPAFFSHASMFGRDRSERERRPGGALRRSTTGPASTEDRLGMSEDEGRRRVADLRRRARDLRDATFTSRREARPNGEETPRPRVIRRAFTAVAGSGNRSEGDPMSPAVKRRQRLKGNIKNIAERARPRRKPKKPTPDQVKSAELVAELSAGVPAALILASMFQTDDHGHKRIPVLLEQLKVRLVKVDEDEKKKLQERHPIFHIQLEYGNGLTRMTWTIERSLADLLKLHFKYRTWVNAQKVIQLRSDRRIKLPHFPSSAFPYARGLRGFREDTDSEGEVDMNAEKSTTHGQEKQAVRSGEKQPQGSTPEAATRDPEKSAATRPPDRSKLSPSFLRRRSSLADGLMGAQRDGAAGAGGAPKSWPERQREMLEKYLHDMIRFLMFRPQNMRLCKFLELSALGIRLAAEGSYHGKEGPLTVQSGRGPATRRFRGNGKWFIVRHSYIACVNSPEEIAVSDIMMVDSDFKFEITKWRPALAMKEPGDLAAVVSGSVKPQHQPIKLQNSERKMYLVAKNSRLAAQFAASLQHVMETSPWCKKQRFDSFAPIRHNVHVQWLVDGRDYMWNVSRAISMAKDAIYIHDWWLSPELYMRRPAAISREWRLDRLLKRKAEEGVRIFVIVYRNIESAIPIDSSYTKVSLLGLHPNIQVQRSPNQMRQGTFFWAHHEKLCIVDHTIAFVGGIDLCFGRWDTPSHELTDNKLTGFEDNDLPKTAENCQLWPGKDYSNPRVQDFFNLGKPYEEMYDRSQVPRMPWHDISMQLIGQPARDLTRHFVQRWNYILRQRKPSRPTPYLLPPPELEEPDLAQLGMTGSCEVQLLRSCAMWSIGTPDRKEHSIMNAYVKLIQESQHFVYIENQFFITSTRALGDRIENTIGDALVERIIRAARNNEAWRCVIIIPLMPGFQNTVDSQDGTSIRLIMLCQYRSICRGENSIFGRLLKEGIEPENYIQFFGLRTWGKLGSNDMLMTEQLYIHAKCMIVDDRSVLIGSANINDRSLLGDRDSEVAALVRDTEMRWSTMNGEPFEVGRYAHSLRMRLMREHLGIDVDNLALEEVDDEHDEPAVDDTDAAYAGSASDASSDDASDTEVRPSRRAEIEALGEMGGDDNLRPPFVEQRYRDRSASGHNSRRRHASAASGQRSLSAHAGDSHIPLPLPPPPPLMRLHTAELGLPLPSQLPPLPASDDTDIGGPRVHRSHSGRSTASMLSPQVANLTRPEITKDCMRDPLNDDFYDGIWQTVADNNTLLFRTVFRCMPDNEAKTWSDYKDFTSFLDRFQRSMGARAPESQPAPENNVASGPPGSAHARDRMRLANPLLNAVGGAVEVDPDAKANTADPPPAIVSQPSTEDEPHADPKPDALRLSTSLSASANDLPSPQSTQHLSPMGSLPHAASMDSRVPLRDPAAVGTGSNTPRGLSPKPSVGGGLGSQRKRRRARTVGATPSGTSRHHHHHHFHRADEPLPRDVAEDVLHMVQGHLVVWPYDWLSKEEENDNWMFAVDGIAPLEIYN